jgi:hypothetical protein
MWGSIPAASTNFINAQLPTSWVVAHFIFTKPPSPVARILNAFRRTGSHLPPFARDSRCDLARLQAFIVN